MSVSGGFVCAAAASTVRAHQHTPARALLDAHDAGQGDVVAVTPAHAHRAALHPLHALFLSFPFPLFLGALLSDLAYDASFEVQWTNFSQWLIAGALVGGGFAMVWALVNLLRSTTRTGRSLIYFVTLLAMWVLGFINALVHAKDAWASMPAGLYLSVVVTLLAFVAAWTGYSGPHAREVK
jgi:uncharacterized membrane protein